MPGRLRLFIIRVLAWDYLVPAGVALLLGILALSLYTVYVDTQAMRGQLNHDFNRLQSVIARQVADELSSELRDITVEIERLKRSLYQIRTPGDARERLRVSLDYLQYKGLLEIGLVDTSGNTVEAVSLPGVMGTPPDSVREICRSDSARVILGPVIVMPLSGDGTRLTGFVCGRAPMNDGRPLVLYIRLDVARLVKSITAPIRSGASGYAWVIDDRGRFLYHPDTQFIGMDAFSVREQRDRNIDFAAINEIMRTRMLAGEEGTGQYVSGWHLGTRGEVSKLIAFCPVTSPVFATGRFWSVAVTAPVSEVAGPVADIRSRHLWIEGFMLAGILGFGLIVFLYQRRVSRILSERVSEQEEYMLAIVQNTVDAIVFIDNDNRVRMWNRGAEMIFGYTAAEMMGSSFQRLVPPELSADRELGCIMDRVYREGHIRNHQTQRLTKSGRRITVNISRTLIRDNDGAPIGSTAIIKDVTDKVDMEKHIYNTEKLASIGILAAGVAHEINNPLAIILGFTDLLKERFKPDQPEFGDLMMIEENANAAKAIVQNLLGFARVSEGMSDAIDIYAALDKVLAVVTSMLASRKVELESDIAEDLPNVRGDSREFQQVIFNLVNNAVAAMGEAGGTLTIRAYPSRDGVAVQVEDTGEGIPERIQAQIFDPFFTTKKVGQGTGLGLSLCYGIVSKYGGHIDFQSNSREDHPDRPSGSTFTVTLPAYRPQTDDERGEPT